jgi:hypothetical protein
MLMREFNAELKRKGLSNIRQKSADAKKNQNETELAINTDT